MQKKILQLAKRIGLSDPSQYRAYCLLLSEMASFDVMGWNETYRKDWPSVNFEEPIHLTHWTRGSATEGGKISYGDASGFRPYTPLEVPSGTSLEKGFPESYISKPPGETVGIDVVIGAMKHADLGALNGGVVTFRNNINKIFGTTIDPKKEWVVGACMLSDHPTLFLDIEDNGSDKSYPDAERFTYYGYKFETISTGGGDGIVDSTSESVVLTKSRLNDIDFIVAAEVDCCDMEELPGKDGIPDMSTLVELKTSRMPSHQNQQRNAQKFKYSKWWLQSLFGGVPRIAVGFWEDKGIINKIQVFKTHDLPNLAMVDLNKYQARQMWRPSQILSSGLDILLWMRSYAEHDRDNHILFAYDPQSQIISGSICQGGRMLNRIRSSLGFSS